MTGKLSVVSFFETATMQRGTVFPTIVHAASNPPSGVDEREDGTAVIRGFRIFRHGTFRDSLGIERTWEPLHLDQMALHFDLLRDNDILPNVPMRTDHSWSVKDVVGYFLRVYRDPLDDQYLSSDFEFTEPDAYQKWKRGTYRSRSLEVGMYESNDGSPYFPVVMGCAFVDLPAVEGLHSKTRTSGPGFHALPEPTKEKNGMTDEEFRRACEYAAWVQAAEYAQRIEDWTRAATYAAALEQHTQNAVALGVRADHGLPGAGHVFRVNGQPTSDPNAVQTHITVLEAAITETTKANRTEFVNNLVKENKIGANQAPLLISMVTDPQFTEAQFKAFQASYEAAPPQGLFAPHGGSGGGGTQDGGGGNAADDLATQTAIVDRLRATGMSDDKLKATQAYRRMIELQGQKA